MSMIVIQVIVMCFYCKAASTYLIPVSESDLPDYFRDMGIDLSVLGRGPTGFFRLSRRQDQLTLKPCTCSRRRSRKILLSPFYDSPLPSVWEEWDQLTRRISSAKQSELQLAQLLLRFYAGEFATAYRPRTSLRVQE